MFALKTREPARLATGTNVTFRFPAGLKPSPDCIARFQEFLLFDLEVLAAEPGYYTWMLKLFGEGLRLVAAPVYSKQEVGTLHANLDALTTDGTVWIAGELHINPDHHLTYNILSGTYTAKLDAATQTKRRDALIDFLETHGASRDKITIVGEGVDPLLETAGEFRLPSFMEEFYTGSCGMGATAFAPRRITIRRKRRSGSASSASTRGRSPRSKRRAR
jgi:hypothetical protein